jgi:hypothetical protein
MHNHGKGPKDTFVRRYGRWRKGQYQSVRSALRGSWHKERLRRSPDQLDFGF